MKFSIGDKAVVPSHGVGVIKDIENLTMGGETWVVYVIKILDNAMTYKVPVDMVETNGIRGIMSVDAIDKVYAVLADRDKPADKQTWNRRYREYMNKIKTGDPLEVAAVLRDLAILRSEKSLSFGERKMYDQAHGLLVQEIAVARDVDENLIQDEIEKIFEAADAAANRTRKARPTRKAFEDGFEDEEPEEEEEEASVEEASVDDDE
jgi:CarD family transcriptional regulator